MVTVNSGSVRGIRKGRGDPPGTGSAKDNWRGLGVISAEPEVPADAPARGGESRPPRLLRLAGGQRACQDSTRAAHPGTEPQEDRPGWGSLRHS